MSKTLYLICFLISLLSCSVARSQEITLNRDGASLQELFLDIHQQTGYFFYYSNKDLSGAKPVSLHVSKASMEEVLNLCFAGQPLIYRLDNKTIVVQKKPAVNESLIDVKGKILNEQDEPVEDVSVQVQGTRIVTSTNSDGEFTLEKVPDESVLVISHVGYLTQTLSLNKKANLTVILKRSVSKLDEVQVIAYGTTTQRLSTGNVSKLGAEEISNQPVSDPVAAMEGRMPGVFIQQNSGVPGGSFTVQIRGQNSLRSDGNNPLYIVDGVQFSSSPLDNPYTATGGIGSSPFNNLNLSDIESIEVLKDADATAIYGSRGSNGVVLITTKKGKPGKTRVDLGYSTGIEGITRDMHLLNTPTYLQMRRNAFFEDGEVATPSNAPDILVWDTTRSTDWQKELIGQTARRTEIHASVFGGNKYTQFLLGAAYNMQTTVFPGEFFDKKGSVHLNLDNTSENEKFKTNLLLSFIHDDRYMPQSNFMNAVMVAPDAPPVQDSTGELNWASSTWINPGSYLLQTNRDKSDNLIANLNLSYQVLPGLQLKSSMGYNNLELGQVGINPLSSFNPAWGYTSGYTFFTQNKMSSWVVEPEISYGRKMGKASLQLQVGGTIQDNTQTTLNQFGQGFASDKQLQNLQAASTVLVLNAGVTEYRYVGLYSRLSFNWQDKYLLNATARRDGSSRFGLGKQFGNFGALGAAWIFSRENWTKNHLPGLSFGKLRLSYGTAGNDQIADYGYLDSYQSTGYVYEGIGAMAPQNLANADYSWETIQKAEAGLQTGFLKDHILFTISYYQNRSSNQLVGYSLPAITGFNSVQANLPANVENSGWEMEFNTINIHRDNFNWASTANLTIPRNRLLSYPNLAGSTYSSTYVVGQSLFISKAYQYLGVDPHTGVYNFMDYDKDGSISYPNDAQFIQKTGYDFYGGIGNTISYKAFQFDLFIQFVRQISINYYSNFEMPGSLDNSGSGNQPSDVLDHWQNNGDQARIQRFSRDFSSGAGAAYNDLKSSNRAYTNGSFVRLKNISVSYRFSQRLMETWHISQCKIYLQAQNLLTFTSYTGFDPESGSGLPPLKNFVAGIQISL